MARRFVVVASLVVVSAGCAAIVGLQDPSPMEEGAGGDASTSDAPPSTTDGGTEASVAPEIGYGSGSEGPITVTERKSVNAYAPLAASAGGGAVSITLGMDASMTTIPVKAGDVLLLVQSATPGVKPPVNTSPLDTDVGTWELVKVKAVNGDIVDLVAPLVHAFSAPGAQAVRVLQATTVNVAGDGGAIAPPKWDGLTGGVVAILATDSIVLTGQIDASLSGYRGGRAFKTSTSFYTCNANEGYIDAGFAPRGEGFGAADAGYGGARGGRGNLGNGGGGGDCLNAGGAGGGNGGRGGPGGQSWINDGSREVGGMGGAALTIPTGVSRLRFGGGGGAGEADDNALGNGGIGGGVIFVRAPKLTGTGILNARGGAGSDIVDDGAGGGGAGGTVYLDLTEPPTCGRISVYGGNGGDTTNYLGPGGGGGGGLVFMKTAPSSACLVDVTSGAGGTDVNAPGPRGAGPAADKRDAGPFLGVISTALAP